MPFSTDNYEWAKSFLSSGAIPFLENNTGTISLTIPSGCPNTSVSEKTPLTDSDGSNSEDWKGKENIQGHDQSPGKDANKRRKSSTRQTPIVESQVRRSERLRQNNNGFKNSRCTVKKCTACTPQPYPLK